MLMQLRNISKKKIEKENRKREREGEGSKKRKAASKSTSLVTLSLHYLGDSTDVFVNLALLSFTCPPAVVIRR